MLYRLEKQFTTDTIDCFLESIDKIDRITLGTAQETQSMIYASMEQFRQKISEINTSSAQNINNLKQFLNQMTLAKPEEFRYAFDR